MKHFSVLMLFAILLLQTACASESVGGETDTADTAQTPVTESAEPDPDAVILDRLPADTDFGGKQIRIRINTFDQTQYDAELFMKGPEEADGDIVYDAIIERNNMVAERLNVEFVYDISNFAYDGVYPDLEKIIMAGDDVYDIIAEQQYGMLLAATNNLLYDFYDSDINDFSQIYWWEEYMEQIQLNLDARYIVAGDYFLDVVEVASAVFVNKNMYEQHYESLDTLYQLVFDGKWTIDALGQYIKDFSIDVNGDGKLAPGDVFAMNFSRNSMDAFTFGSGISFVERGEDGFPVLNAENPAISDFTERFAALYFEPGTTYDFNVGVTEAEYYRNQRTAFASRELLFLNDYLAAVKNLRDMEDNYGILPIPKMDESVDAYRTLSHDTAIVGGIPTTCPEPEIGCTVLEALCSMSHNTTMRTYFESAMKVKYARDEASSQIIDLLHDSITMNFCYAFSPQINAYMPIFRQLFDAKASNYTTKYAAIKSGVEAKLEELIETYKLNSEN